MARPALSGPDGRGYARALTRASRRKEARLTLARPDAPAGLTAAPPVAERERILAAVVALCEATPAAWRPGPREALGEVFLRLVSEAEHDIRLRLAERIASASWAPRALIAALALDDIDIARPVIAASPVLQDEDLLRVLTRATLEHQVAVARRPGLSEVVARAVVDGGQPLAMAALAANGHVRLPADAMERLAAAARRVAALRAPLVGRSELSAELARGLYAWVGETLRRALTERFALDPAALDAPLGQAVSDAFAGAPAPAADELRAEAQESEARLVAKLEGSGQLKPGYLLRVLREGRLSLFQAALAALAAMPPSDVRAALDAPTPELLALACVAVGIDRSAFPTLLALVRSLNGERPGHGGAAQVQEAFALRDREAAAARLRALASGAEPAA